MTTDITVIAVPPAQVVAVTMAAAPLVVVAAAASPLVVVPPAQVVVVAVAAAPLLVVPLGYGLQGPPGPPGLNGSSASAPYITFSADGPLGGNRAVRLVAGLARYASSSALADAGLVLGITQGAAVSGAPVQIQTSGLMTEPSWTWTADQPVFCGTNGTLTQTAPTAGFDLILGIALSAIQIHIGARMPIALA